MSGLKYALSCRYRIWKRCVASVGHKQSKICLEIDSAKKDCAHNSSSRTILRPSKRLGSNADVNLTWGNGQRDVMLPNIIICARGLECILCHSLACSVVGHNRNSPPENSLCRTYLVNVLMYYSDCRLNRLCTSMRTAFVVTDFWLTQRWHFGITNTMARARIKQTCKESSDVCKGLTWR